jgi:hypothetical protein
MKKTSTEKLILELDGETVLLETDGHARLLSSSEARGIPGDKWFVTDLLGARPQVMTIQSAFRFVELALRQRLRESGEVSGPAWVVSHWKENQGEDNTTLLFTAVEREVVAPYLTDARGDPHHHLVFGINALLLAGLFRYAGNRNTVLLFEHGRHVDFIVGRTGTVFGANRVSSHSAHSAMKEALLGPLRDELRTILMDARILLEQVVYVRWRLQRVEHSEPLLTETDGTGIAALDIPDDVPWVKDLAESFQATHRLLSLNRYPLSDGEGVLITSLTDLVSDLPTSAAINPPFEKYRYAAARWRGGVMAVVWWLTLALFGVGGWFHYESLRMAVEVQPLRAAMITFPARITVALPTIETELAFGEQMMALRDQSPIAELLNRVQQIRPPALHLNRVSLHFPGRSGHRLRMEGQVTVPFRLAADQFNTFLTGLERLGYRIEQRQATTHLNRLTFSLSMAFGLPEVAPSESSASPRHPVP